MELTAQIGIIAALVIGYAIVACLTAGMNWNAQGKNPKEKTGNQERAIYGGAFWPITLVIMFFSAIGTFFVSVGHKLKKKE